MSENQNEAVNETPDEEVNQESPSTFGDATRAVTEPNETVEDDSEGETVEDDSEAGSDQQDDSSSSDHQIDAPNYPGAPGTD